MSRYLVIAVLVAAFGAMAGQALAAEAGSVVAQEEAEEPVEEEAPQEEPAPIPEPAVPAEPPGESPEEPAWTYKFLVPTSLLIAVVVVVGIIVAYFVKVTRSRYRVVE